MFGNTHNNFNFVCYVVYKNCPIFKDRGELAVNIRLVNAIPIINNIKMVDESISRCRYYIEIFPKDFALKLHLRSRLHYKINTGVDY